MRSSDGLRALLCLVLPVVLGACTGTSPSSPSSSSSEQGGGTVEEPPSPSLSGEHDPLALPVGLAALEPLALERDDAAALSEAGRGRLQEAASRCATAACPAQVARAGVARLGAPVYAMATQICVQAADPTACHRGVLDQLAQEAPAASAPAGDWQRAVQTVAVVASVWNPQGEGTLAQAATEHLWATMMALRYAQAPENTAAPLAHLPEPAHPHVRAAMVARAAADAEEAPDTLEGWLARLPPGAEGGAGWAGDVLWQAASGRRRPSVADPAVDLRICVLLVSGRDGRAVPDGRWRAAAAALQALK